MPSQRGEQFPRRRHRDIPGDSHAEQRGQYQQLIERRRLISEPDSDLLRGRLAEAANTAVRKLAELGILTECTGGAHGRVFEAQDVVAVLTSPAAAR